MNTKAPQPLGLSYSHDWPVMKGWLVVFKADIYYHIVGPYIHKEDAIKRGEQQKGFLGVQYWDGEGLEVVK